jgi:hypothetical protein
MSERQETPKRMALAQECKRLADEYADTWHNPGRFSDGERSIRMQYLHNAIDRLASAPPSPTVGATERQEVAMSGSSAAAKLLEMIQGHQYGLRGFGDGSLSRGRNLTDAEMRVIRRALEREASPPVAAPVVPAATERVIKTHGAYAGSTWIVRARFTVERGERIVAEAEAIPGLLHIFGAEQVAAAPVAHAPASKESNWGSDWVDDGC